MNLKRAKARVAANARVATNPKIAWDAPRNGDEESLDVCIFILTSTAFLRWLIIVFLKCQHDIVEAHRNKRDKKDDHPAVSVSKDKGKNKAVEFVSPVAKVRLQRFSSVAAC